MVDTFSTGLGDPTKKGEGLEGRRKGKREKRREEFSSACIVCKLPNSLEALTSTTTPPQLCSANHLVRKFALLRELAFLSEAQMARGQSQVFLK